MVFIQKPQILIIMPLVKTMEHEEFVMCRYFLFA